MKRLKTILLIVLGVYVLVGFLFYLLQEHMIFMDGSLPDDHKFNFKSDFEEVYLEAPQEGRLHALHFTVEAPKGVILYYHGNKTSLDRWGRVVQYHVGLGYDVVVMDYRGYGKSKGQRNMEMILADAQLFYDYTKTRYEEKDIVVYGRSLGSGIASYVAARNSPKQLILETPYYNFRQLVQRYAPIYPIGLFLEYNFKSNEYLQEATCPVAIFHGTSDWVVPYSHGERLYQSLPSGQGTLYTIPEGGHADLVEFEEFRKGLQEVL